MSQLTKAQIANSILINITDPLNKQISASKLRVILNALNESKDEGFSYESTLTRAQVQDLNNTPIAVTAATLGLSSGYGANITKLEYTVDPDGTAFNADDSPYLDYFGANIYSFANIQASSITLTTKNTIDTSTIKDNVGYSIKCATATISGGTNATMRIKVYYNIIAIA
jgi:hypothetical protein